MTLRYITLVSTTELSLPVFLLLLLVKIALTIIILIVPTAIIGYS